MPKVKTITLDGTETAVKFEKGYPYYVITNMGDGELYASGSPGITAYADGVYTILPGMETRISPEKSADTVYLLGSGMVQVRAEEIAVPVSFNPAGKGGEFQKVDASLSLTSENPVQNAVITTALNGKLNSTDIFDWAKSDTKPSYTAEEVGADATGSASTALTAANSYTDIAIANLVGTAPEDLNTLEELAQAYKDNKDFAEILSAAITKKQNVLFLGDIATNNVDWNTLKTTGFYQIGVEEKLSDNSTHGLGGVYGYGMLIIIPGRYTVYQLYINDNTEVYQRQLYNTWRNWKRIDAGAVTIDSALSATSTNAVQNKVVATAIDLKQDKLTKTVLYNTDSSPSPDWNELKEMSIRLVHVGNSLSDSYTHGLGGVYGYGVLSIFSDPSANANIVYQKYVTDMSNQVYMRSLYNSTWRNWKRIDAGAGGYNVTDITDLNTLTETGSYNIDFDEPIDDRETIHVPAGFNGVGLLEVTNTNGRIIWQRLMSDTHNVYIRQKSGSAWDDWDKVGRPI